MTPNVKQRAVVLEKKTTAAKTSGRGRGSAEKNVNERNNQLLQKDETGHKLLQKFIKY